MKKIFPIACLCFASVGTNAQTPKIIGNYANKTNTFTIETIAGVFDKINIPRDLDFHPINGQLWVVNQGTESSGGSTVRITDPGKTSKTTLWQKDGNSWHFMSLPSGIAFSENGNFGTSTSVYDANHNGGTPFTGPALWSSDPLVYAMPSGGNGSHLDMLHASPYCMGIAAEQKNVFWVTDMNTGDVVRYDFGLDHGPGADDHYDGIIRRYTGKSISWINQNVSSHLDLDANKKWLYVVDGGGNKVVRLDITTGTKGGTPSFPNYEPVIEYANYDGATWETVVSTGLNQPSGIAVMDNYLLVSEYATGDIVVYGIGTLPAVELNRVKTSPGIQGITIGPDGRIWFVNSTTNIVGRIEPAIVTGISNVVANNAALNVSPNPSQGIFDIYLAGLNSNINAEIVSVTGSSVQTLSLAPAGTRANLSQLAKGIYFIKVRNAEYNITHKIVIE
jgi:hypothetical protein